MDGHNIYRVTWSAPGTMSLVRGRNYGGLWWCSAVSTLVPERGVGFDTFELRILRYGNYRCLFTKRRLRLPVCLIKNALQPR